MEIQNQTAAQVFIKGYGVPMALILTGVALGWYLCRKPA